jgi:membrane-associated phospholipid phosphatase
MGADLSAQYEESRFEKTAVNIFEGFRSAYEWYDIPVAAAYFSRRLIQPENIGDKIVINPAGFEENISRQIGTTGGSSPGSMNKDFIPFTIFYSRLIINTSLNLFTDADIDSRNYQTAFLFHKSLMYTYTLTEYVKSLVKRTRPDGSDNRSFFSGHTSTTFAAATFLYLEMDHIYDSWSLTRNNLTARLLIQGSTFGLFYGWAGYVGYSRIKDNKHYLTDVMLGAAVGSLISYFVYNLYKPDDDPGTGSLYLNAYGDYLTLSWKLKI